VFRVLPGLRDGAVVPDVALVREAARHETNLALLDVLKNNQITRLKEQKTAKTSFIFILCIFLRHQKIKTIKI
jgi:hypothetical protein